ncbi:transcriptional regulator, LysR family [Catenulispora acidiphila DSM 44928]|uniref:Transcriptional regulator, LysR family n=1 Tax=Catenulispora acidiphila (strain DSM 44928 / JCM 14897 / NBRC 102108 / NRRL B-24433 / ID139908) TaxID=479433 RepID=C7Q1T9_CATAD|nr:LysR family transcriptional regulator [Catenulispora acidiphila]ACU75640.1 transcriptional regulator, LysR family [Catenulispora acidiphila DSM 44928]
MDLDAVRTFVAAAETGRFQDAANDLAVTQQAVSKRIAGLEKELAVRLFARTARGAQLTIDGQAFLPHARALMQAEERAIASVRPGRRALRVDVLVMRSAMSALMRGFHETRPEIELDVVTLFDADAALAAVEAGTIDATFRYVAGSRRLPPGVESARVLDERLDLLVGPRHPLAGARSVTPAQLVGHRIWIPGLVPGVEWALYYDQLVAAFGLSIDGIGPHFGSDHLMDVIADATDVASLVGEKPRLAWSDGHDLRRIPVVDPTPVYPHSLVWRTENAHPALATLRTHLAATGEPTGSAGTWVPPGV